jgi:hypothetical protein
MLELNIGKRQSREPGVRGMLRGVVNQLPTRLCRLYQFH